MAGEISISGPGVNFGAISAAQELFDDQVSSMVQIFEGLKLGRYGLDKASESYNEFLNSVVENKILKISDLEERSFKYYAGRMVTEGIFGITDVGERQYRYVEPDELVGKRVLGVGVSNPRFWHSLFDYMSGKLTDGPDSEPKLTIAHKGRTYTGGLTRVKLEVIGDADEKFVQTHQQVELSEAHSL